MDISIRKIYCIGSGYVGGPTMNMMASKCPDLIFNVVDIKEKRIASWNNEEVKDAGLRLWRLGNGLED